MMMMLLLLLLYDAVEWTGEGTTDGSLGITRAGLIAIQYIVYSTVLHVGSETAVLN